MSPVVLECQVLDALLAYIVDYLSYEQFGLAGLRADRVNGMCGIVSVAQHCTTTL